MPRFHFDLREDSTVLTDNEGTELADEKAAERQAIETATSVARDAFVQGTVNTVQVEVRQRAEAFLKVAVTLKVEHEG